MKMNLRPKLRQRMSLWMGRQQALLLEATEPQFARIVHDLETDPLFRKLAFAYSQEDRAIRLHRPWRAICSPAFLELKDDLIEGRGDAAQRQLFGLVAKDDLVFRIGDHPDDLPPRDFAIASLDAEAPPDCAARGPEMFRQGLVNDGLLGRSERDVFRESLSFQEADAERLEETGRHQIGLTPWKTCTVSRLHSVRKKAEPFATSPSIGTWKANGRLLT